MAVAGRSNAGKSTAINTLLGNRSMARVSRTPGRTRLYNYFELGPRARLVDLPGYGYAAVDAPTRASWESLGEALRGRSSFAALLLVVDSRRGVGDMDLALLDWAGRPAAAVHVLLAKADKLTRAQSLAALRQAERLLAGRGSVQLFSARSGMGVEETRAIMRRWVKIADSEKK
jgi:GTP-binding protein